MTELNERLELLGLSQYYDSLVSEGFDTWDTLLDITESDLTYLNFKLGHRRKLQRAIADSRGQLADRALIAKLPVTDGLYRSDDSGTERRDVRSPAGSSMQTGVSNAGTKRKYRRHPKPDPNAPERPPSAYVIFSNQVREDLKGQELSFTEIAKVVGERWQVLPAEKRESYEQQANSAKERYYSAMSDYKRTPEYAQYQAYLVEFKAKHGASRAEGKRSRVETETSSISEPALATQEATERRGGSRSAPQLTTTTSKSSTSSPSNVTPLYNVTHRRPSPSSSAVWSESMNSPIKQDTYSPEQSPTVPAAAMSARDHRAAARRAPSRIITQSDLQHAPPQQMPLSQYPTYRPSSEAWSAADPAHPAYLTSLPQREARSSVGIPELTHQDSTLSSGGASQPQTSPLHLLPPIDATKALDRRLPQPVMATTNRQSPLDHRAPLPMPLQLAKPPAGAHSAHLRHGSGGASEHRSAWPALLQATNLAREAELPGSRSRPARPPNEDPNTPG